MNPEEFERHQEALRKIAVLFDKLEETVNSLGPVDMLTAYFVSLGAVEEFDMEKEMLERFVAVLMADRTYHAVS